MKNLVKLVLVILVAAFAGNLLTPLLAAIFNGSYLETAGFFKATLAVLAPFAIVAAAVWLSLQIVRFKTVAMIVLVALATAASACSYAAGNVQTLVSDNCGVSWQLIPAGKSVPWRNMPCEYKVTVPNYPMQGETRFKTSFKDRVLATIEVSYDYSITDALAFVNEAKYLGKPNSESDDQSNNAGVYESAENSVIDKRIREVAATLLLQEDIVDFSQADFEDKLQNKVNDELKKRGVQLNSLAFVPTPEEQTRLAIDMMTAMKVYSSRGLSDLGQKVAVARAGATKLDVTSTTSVPGEKK